MIAKGECLTPPLPEYMYTILEPPVFAAIRFNQEIQTTTISQLVRLIFRFGGVHLPGV